MTRELLPRILGTVALLTLTACASGHSSSEEKQAAAAPGKSAADNLNSSLQQWIRGGIAFRWKNGQPMPDEVRQVWSQLGRGGTGYGFRTFQIRRDTAASDSSQTPPALLASMEYWRVTLDDLQTSVVGDIGLAWGVYTEEFKAQGQPPESVRVRFTNTLRWNGERWENLLYHRDAQLFGKNGGYLVRQ